MNYYIIYSYKFIEKFSWMTEILLFTNTSEMYTTQGLCHDTDTAKLNVYNGNVNFQLNSGL